MIGMITFTDYRKFQLASHKPPVPLLCAGWSIGGKIYVLFACFLINVKLRYNFLNLLMITFNKKLKRLQINQLAVWVIHINLFPIFFPGNTRSHTDIVCLFEDSIYYLIVMHIDFTTILSSFPSFSSPSLFLLIMNICILTKTLLMACIYKIPIGLWCTDLMVSCTFIYYFYLYSRSVLYVVGKLWFTNLLIH